MGAQHSAARRVPMHLTMTLEELLAKNDTSSTHRMVEHAQATEPKRAARRVPMHLTMTLEELLATNDTSSTHRMVAADPEDMSMDEMLEMQREEIGMIFGTMERSEAACTAQRQEVSAIFDMMHEADFKAQDAFANPSVAERIDFGWRGGGDIVVEEST